MVKSKEVKKNVESWLLDFERHIGGSCVVSLLIQDKKIFFLSVLDKKRYIDKDESDDDERASPPVNSLSRIEGKMSEVQREYPERPQPLPTKPKRPKWKDYFG